MPFKKKDGKYFLPQFRKCSKVAIILVRNNERPFFRLTCAYFSAIFEKKFAINYDWTLFSNMFQ